MDLVAGFISDSRQPAETIEAAKAMMSEAFRDFKDADVILARHSKRWQLGRLALVDRNILRLAIHEFLTDAAPPKVIITEAIKLAQEFSTAESPRFINGVLDAVLKEISGGARPDQ